MFRTLVLWSNEDEESSFESELLVTTIEPENYRNLRGKYTAFIKHVEQRLFLYDNVFWHKRALECLGEICRAHWDTGRHPADVFPRYHNQPDLRDFFAPLLLNFSAEDENVWINTIVESMPKFPAICAPYPRGVVTPPNV